MGGGCGCPAMPRQQPERYIGDGGRGVCGCRAREEQGRSGRKVARERNLSGPGVSGVLCGGGPDTRNLPQFAPSLREFGQADDKYESPFDGKLRPNSSVRIYADVLRVRIEDALTIN